MRIKMLFVIMFSMLISAPVSSQNYVGETLMSEKHGVVLMKEIKTEAPLKEIQGIKTKFVLIVEGKEFIVADEKEFKIFDLNGVKIEFDPLLFNSKSDEDRLKNLAMLLLGSDVKLLSNIDITLVRSATPTFSYCNDCWTNKGCKQNGCGFTDCWWTDGFVCK